MKFSPLIQSGKLHQRWLIEQHYNIITKNKIKYTGHNDWRLKLEIYSNIDDTPDLTSNLLFDNTYSLEYVDYIHLLADYNEIADSNIIKFVDYKSCNFNYKNHFFILKSNMCYGYPRS